MERSRAILETFWNWNSQHSAVTRMEALEEKRETVSDFNT